MSYPLALLIIFSTLFAFYAVMVLIRWRMHRRLLASLEHTPFPTAWRSALEQTPHYPKLTVPERTMLERAVLRFVHTQRFTGVGMTVAEEMKAVIAFYACLMTRYISGDPFAALGGIILYADGFWVDEHVEDTGIVSLQRVALDGQSTRDTVVLSWPDVQTEVFHAGNDNVVIHEFAHLLDFADGFSDGTPPLPHPKVTAWNHTIAHALKSLQDGLDHGDRTDRFHWLGEYAATNEAECFAVASERFFMQPQRLEADFPHLFGLLKSFYGPPLSLH